MSADLTPAGIAEARRQGYLAELLLATAGLSSKAPRQRTAEPLSDNVHVAHPGAWPTGASRPAPVAPPSGPQIDAALTDYRRWLVADRPAAPTRCPCTGCTPGGIT